MVTVKVISRKTSKPMEGALVAVYYGNMIVRKSTKGRTDQQGEVHLDVGPGRYGLTVNAPHFSEDIELKAGRNVVYV